MTSILSIQLSRSATRVTYWLALLLVALSAHARSSDGASDQLPREQREPFTYAEALEDKLGEVERQLWETATIGTLTKLSLKSELESLLEAFSRLHLGDGEHELSHLIRRFDLLLIRTLGLLRSQDPALVGLLREIRPEIVATLSHPDRYARVFGPRSTSAEHSRR